ncbi:MAG TPA: SRPBCC family protein [Ktedonobacterales bacterium]|nr:SRPBCC family protein [Ktedonobacterales bacterium]
MLEGTGESVTAAAPAVAFNFLADPRNAGLWFAGAGFEEPPTGPPRAGQTWSFAQTPGTRRVQPVRMSIYEPPSRFVWETRLPTVLTNFTWEMRCDPAGAERPGGTHLRLTYRLRPGLVQWLTTAVGFSLVGRALHEQAQRAADRAAEALSAASSPSSGQPNNARGNDAGRKRKRR